MYCGESKKNKLCAGVEGEVDEEAKDEEEEEEEDKGWRC